MIKFARSVPSVNSPSAVSTSTSSWTCRTSNSQSSCTVVHADVSRAAWNANRWHSSRSCARQRRRLHRWRSQPLSRHICVTWSSCPRWLDRLLESTMERLSIKWVCEMMRIIARCDDVHNDETMTRMMGSRALLIRLSKFIFFKFPESSVGYYKHFNPEDSTGSLNDTYFTTREFHPHDSMFEQSDDFLFFLFHFSSLSTGWNQARNDWILFGRLLADIQARQAR